MPKAIIDRRLDVRAADQPGGVIEIVDTLASPVSVHRTLKVLEIECANGLTDRWSAWSGVAPGPLSPNPAM
jgi:hypothetical protein